MANEYTKIKTRFGKILERVTAKALVRADLSSRFDWQYEPDAVKLDFTIPDSETPERVIEVTQTETRDSLKRKLLRYFELVAEVKVHFGPNVGTISMIYGRPIQDLPEANLRASLSFFDAAFMPRVDTVLNTMEKQAIAELEAEALRLATQRIPQNLAAAQLEQNHSDAMNALVHYFKQELPKVKPNPLLRQMWMLEWKRVQVRQIPQDLAPIQTYYKRGILQPLFLTKEQLQQVLQIALDTVTGNLRADLFNIKWPIELAERFVKLGLAKEQRSILGKRLQFSKEFQSILNNPKAVGIIRLAREVLEDNKPMRWFFEDIYDEDRRLKMATHYLFKTREFLSDCTCYPSRREKSH